MSTDGDHAAPGARTDDHDERLRAVMQRVPALAVRDARAVPLEGGITNRNYRVDAGGQSFVVRLAGDNTALLGIDRAREHACARAAEACGVGPAVVAALPEHGALVTRFVHGRTLTPDALRDRDALARVAAALRRFHDGAPVPGHFSPFATAREYHARARGGPLPAAVATALAAVTRLERALAPAEPPRPCHNDLLPANLIEDGAAARVWIIDWEYAAMGDRFFDLGNLAVNHELDADGERALLQAYFGDAREGDLRRLRLMRCASDLRESLWGFLQAGISALDFDFRAYGQTYLDRFHAAFAALEPQLP